jgi:ParB-like chromosome segregation protein Spo0J
LTALSPLALQNAALLRRLAAPEPFWTLSTLAREIAVDRSNLNRKIRALTGEGLLEERRHADQHAGIALTDAGRAAVEALARLDGPPPAADAAPGHVRLSSHDITFDPDNARQWSGLDDDAIETMAASIRDRHAQGLPGLITPPTVRRIDDGWRLVHGERRLRGWRMAEERMWTPCLTHDCPIFTGDDDQAADEGLVENIQRADLDNLEIAFALRDRAERSDPPLSAAALAARLGRHERWVAERLKVAREAAPDLIAAYRAGAITWTALRDSVKQALPSPHSPSSGTLPRPPEEGPAAGNPPPPAAGAAFPHDDHSSPLGGGGPLPLERSGGATVEGVPNGKSPQRPTPPPSDPIIAGLRAALHGYHAAIYEPVRILNCLLEGEGVTDDEMASAARALESAAARAAPYLRKDPA